MKFTRTKHYRRGKVAAYFLMGFVAGVLEGLFHGGIRCFSLLRKLKVYRPPRKRKQNPNPKTLQPYTPAVEMAEKAMVKLGFRQAEARRRVGLVVSRPDAPKDASSLLAAAMTASESREGA